MTLRTPNPYSNTRSMLDLQRVKERMAVLTQQISTGQRIVRAGDDPTGSALLMDFRSSISRNDQYSKQVDSASWFLQSTETSLTGVSDNLMRLMEMTVQALVPPVSAASRAALVTEAQGILTNMFALANRQEQGKFLFSGTRTNTQPFVDAATPYAGDSNPIDLDVSLGATVTTNLTGDAVFYGGGAQGSSTDLFQQVSNFITGLQSNDTAQIQAASDNIETIFAGIQTRLTEVGGRQAALSQIKTTLGNFSASLQSIQESYESVDYPKAVTEFEQENIVQQAALSMLSKTNAQNLFNYLS